MISVISLPLSTLKSVYDIVKNEFQYKKGTELFIILDATIKVWQNIFLSSQDAGRRPTLSLLNSPSILITSEKKTFPHTHVYNIYICVLHMKVKVVTPGDHPYHPTPGH